MCVIFITVFVVIHYSSKRKLIHMIISSTELIAPLGQKLDLGYSIVITYFGAWYIHNRYSINVYRVTLKRISI